MSMLKTQRLQKQIDKLNNLMLAERLENEMNVGKINESWMIKFNMIIGIFEAALAEAGTLNEAKNWYKQWCIDIDQADTPQQIADLIEKHGFEFDVKTNSSHSAYRTR